MDNGQTSLKFLMLWQADGLGMRWIPRLGPLPLQHTDIGFSVLAGMLLKVADLGTLCNVL